MKKPLPNILAFWGIICMPLLTFFGCCIGVVKTSLNNLEPKRYATLGVTVDLPPQPLDPYAKYILNYYDSPLWQKNANCIASLRVAMHPAWSGLSFTEPVYLLRLDFDRLSPRAFEIFTQGEHFLNSDRVFGYDKSVFQPTVSYRVVVLEMEHRTYRCFRKDIKLPNGDYVVAQAKILEAPSAVPDITAEIKSIHEILDSVKPIDDSKRR